MKRLGPISFGIKVSCPEEQKVIDIRHKIESLQAYFFSGVIERARVRIAFFF